ncbi:glycosyltransferase family 4 protein [Halotia branconii]|uniref:Glycosyltransferase n=1 Tax=Halotia branconii CENA392 TaxID=1539056 RepID=A0AAJ6NP77_9CYAN|nr:glycosyltransferase [Halotia branconii]WGV24080.1 glycosyltransferase [Halotia branconii CENA392]
MNRPLKILMVLHMPWDPNLGGPRVQLELADEFLAMGHEVEKFDYNDAFGQTKPFRLAELVPPILTTKAKRLAELTRPSFSSQAQKFVQANAHRFDIIDAHQGNLPFSKQELGFRGLLVARSVGLMPLLQEFLEFQNQKWPSLKKRNLIGNLLSSHAQKQNFSNFIPSLKASDLINLPNHDELMYVSNVLGLGQKSVVFPFGLSQQRHEAFLKAIQPAEVRLTNKQVAFIGAWGTRKGSKDWGEIIKLIRNEIPEAQFLFLGTGFSMETVLADINLPSADGIEIIPNYTSEELPKLLSRATVGAFPSYMEGFGFAVLEKLACGLPTVAYDIPGPREMLGKLDIKLMTKPGDIEQFAVHLVKLLRLDQTSYSQVSQHCVEIANKFTWRTIAENTINTYTQLFAKIKSM